MSGETEQHVSGWTTDTLKAHYDTVMGQQQRAVEAALVSAEKAVDKAEKAATDRFEAVNEFRGQLNDQAATFMSRAEAFARFETQTSKLEELASRVDKMDGSDLGADAVRRMMVALAGVMVAAMALGITVLAVVLR